VASACPVPAYARARRLRVIMCGAFEIPNETAIKSVRKTDIQPTQSVGIIWSTGVVGKDFCRIAVARFVRDNRERVARAGIE